jgi:hypothetical protein
MLYMTDDEGESLHFDLATVQAVEVGKTADFAKTAYNSSNKIEVRSVHSSSERDFAMDFKTGHPATDHSTYSAFSTSSMYPNSASETDWLKASANSSAGSDTMGDVAGSNYSACSVLLLPAQGPSSSFGLPFSSLMLGVLAALPADHPSPSQAYIAACEQKLELQATEMRQQFQDELAAKDTIIWDLELQATEMHQKFQDELAAKEAVILRHELYRDSSIRTAKHSVDSELLYHVPILVSSQYNVDLHDEWDAIPHKSVSPVPYGSPIEADDIRNWISLKSVCNSSTTVNVTLSPLFEMGNFPVNQMLLGAIDFSGRHIEVWGNGNILNASNLGRLFYGSGQNSSLELHNITLANAVVPNDAHGMPGHHGGAIFVDSGNVTIYSSTFVANYADVGGCIFGLNAAIVIIYASNLKSNGSRDAEEGGAIALAYGAAMEVYGSTFAENVVGRGPAVSFAS